MLLPTMIVACDLWDAPPPPNGAGPGCTTCDGAFEERWPSGASRLRGQRSDGRPAGTWIRWTEDGRFDGETTFGDAGELLHRREPSSDGRLLDASFANGVLTGWTTRPPEPMPEWSDGTLGAGTRYTQGTP